MSRPAIDLVRAGLWTIGLLVLLFAADRLLMGPEAPQGWQRASALQQVPTTIGADILPSYLPERLLWPPTRVHWRALPTSAWWMQLQSPSADSLWFGVGDAPPEHPASGCLDDRGCPPGWHALSRQLGTRTVTVVSSLPVHQARQLLQGLRQQAR